jgi:hypothetical protein
MTRRRYLYERRHFRPAFPGDRWPFVIGRVGCGLMMAHATEITTDRAFVTCGNCKRSLWFRQPLPFETAP